MRKHGDGWRFVVGFLVAPLIIPIALLSVFTVASYVDIPKFRARDFAELLSRTLGFSVLVLIIGYLVTLLIAMPVVAWLLGRGQATRTRILALGAGLGGLPFLVYFGYVVVWELGKAAGYPLDAVGLGLWARLDRLSRDVPEALVWVTAGTTCGVATAGALWVLVFRRLNAA